MSKEAKMMYHMELDIELTADEMRAVRASVNAPGGRSNYDALVTFIQRQIASGISNAVEASR